MEHFNKIPDYNCILENYHNFCYEQRQQLIDYISNYILKAVKSGKTEVHIPVQKHGWCINIEEVLAEELDKSELNYIIRDFNNTNSDFKIDIYWSLENV